MLKAWTDCPIAELGDHPNKPAPIREVEVIAYDGDKYVTAIVEGRQVEFKAGYLYTSPGRCGRVNNVQVLTLSRLPMKPEF